MRAIGQALVLTPTTANDAAAGLSNMLHNLGCAVGTASLGTIMTKREQYHSNIISQPVAHGISDPSVVTQKAIVTVGRAVRRQALILGFSDTFAVIGVGPRHRCNRLAVDPQDNSRRWRRRPLS